MTSKTSVKKIYKQLLKKGVINSKVTLGDVWDKQIGGSHYQKFKIQPSKFVIDNKLLYPEGCVIKYIIRHSMKNGKEDLLKAKHFIDMIITRDYP